MNVIKKKILKKDDEGKLHFSKVIYRNFKEKATG